MYLNVLGQENVINNSEHNIIDSFMYHIIECAHCPLRYIQYQDFQRCHNGITDTLQSLGRFYKYVQGLLVLLFLIRLPGPRMQDRALTHLYIYIVREMNDMMMWETPSKTLLRLMMIMSARSGLCVQHGAVWSPAPGERSHQRGGVRLNRTLVLNLALKQSK